MVLGRMADLRKKNCSVHCATNNWMILIGDGKAKGFRMLNKKIAKLDQLIFPASQVMKIESVRIMKKTKVNKKDWITIAKKI